ncbi:putative inositol monophosphatase 3 [Cylas formicarius]|uniref:putative inositol monophosphatase 3 n=1 Tax=Cylas formicarius TaxID=197179 RepID=UPI0029588D19|nr:putative inositol monophosphatase 3 [Cylas formicarius]
MLLNMVLVKISLLSKIFTCLLVLMSILLLYTLFARKPINEQTLNVQISLFSLLKTAIIAAEEGGRYVVSARNNFKIDSKGKTKEGAEDTVTTADFLSHCAMLNVFKTAFADLTVVSEEKTAACENGNVRHESSPWETSVGPVKDRYVSREDVMVWIDPLDATQEYTEKLYEYVTTMACVAVKGRPILGVVHYPFSRTTSWAWVGNVLSPDLRPAEGRLEMQKTKIIVSRSHSGPIKEALAKSMRNFELIVAAGAGFKALKVAKGEVDAYLHATAIKKWDTCAGNAVLDALGGRMTTKHNFTIDYADASDAVNTDGLVATLKNHESFLGKF